MIIALWRCTAFASVAHSSAALSLAATRSASAIVSRFDRNSARTWSRHVWEPVCGVTCASTARRTRRRVPRHAPFAADGALIPPERARLSSDGAGEFLSEVSVVR